jgi:tRNA nucleotidyltransferase/poly(A) polymerase
MAALKSVAPEGYFVGGCVRDWLLNRPLKDLDIAIPSSQPGASPSSVASTGRALAAAVGGTFFWLREEMQVARVLVPGSTPLQIDLVPLAGSLEQDLRRRDFTVNAMAVRVTDGLVPEAPVIDPTGGREDLLQRWLCPAAPDALLGDPLRCLRAFRFRATLGLSFAPELEAAIRAAGPRLAQISGERIRDELFVLLEGEQSPTVIADLLAFNLVTPWSVILDSSARGEGRCAGLSILRSLDTWLRDRAPGLPLATDLTATLDTCVTPPRTRRALTRLAALAIGAGAAAREIAHALRLSAEEARVLVRAVEGAATLTKASPLPGRGRLRFFQKWEPGAMEAVLLAVASDDTSHPRAELTTSHRMATCAAGDATPLEALLAEMLERRLRPLPPLLAGDEVMRLLDMAPGPGIGECLQQVEERRADGLIRTAEEARGWLQGMMR